MRKWPHNSGEKLQEAGYHFIRWGNCPAPQCRAIVLWYLTPKEKQMMIDPETFEPHMAACPARPRPRHHLELSRDDREFLEALRISPGQTK